jgi:hypothetical protein
MIKIMEESKFVTLRLRLVVTIALFAMFAIISSLMASREMNGATIHQIQTADKWAFFQAKGIKATVLESRIPLLELMKVNKAEVEELRETIKQYEIEKNLLLAEAVSLDEKSMDHLKRYDYWSLAIAFFSMSVVLGGITLFSRRKILWFVSIIFGISGYIPFGYALYLAIKIP